MTSIADHEKQIQRLEARAQSRLPWWGKKTRSALFAVSRNCLGGG